MSVSDPYQSFHQAFKHQMTKHYVIDLPNDEYGFAEFSNLLDDIHKQLAGVIIEPLMQGAGGVKFHSADVLAEIHRITKAHNILFVTDEIATGFGRTGNMFACNEAGITPDIMTLSKAFTGGVIGGAATLATTEVYDAFLGDTLDKALMHGPTYMASPLMCAAANASLDLFEQEPRMEQVQTIETRIQDGLEPCREMNGVVDVRVKGAAAAVQLETEGLDIYVLRRMLIERGVWLRPFGDVIYLMPAFTIEEDALESLTKAVVDVTHAWSKGRS
jgi:adenosylmethionine-8-amino-7-oxononanoate aminotransferase